jgi:hypothetical protein
MGPLYQSLALASVPHEGGSFSPGASYPAALMNSARAVLCLALLVSGLGFAQAPVASPPPLVPAEGPPAQEAPVGEVIPHTQRPQFPPSGPFEPANVVLEAAGGMVGAVGLGIGGTAALYGLLSLSSSCDGEDLCPLAAALFALPITALGLPLGVWTVGKLLDNGPGQFLPSFLGTFAGVGAALLLIVTQSQLLIGLGLALLPLSGAVIGYELSRPDVPDEPGGPSDDRRGNGYGSEYSSTSVRLSPVLGFTPGGGLMGGFTARF